MDKYIKAILLVCSVDRKHGHVLRGTNIDEKYLSGGPPSKSYDNGELKIFKTLERNAVDLMKSRCFNVGLKLESHQRY
jgi:hypothetical protein